jgi:hypothetical protein
MTTVVVTRRLAVMTGAKLGASSKRENRSSGLR